MRLADGEWTKELTLSPGRYEYRFVVDGEWADDPAAIELIPNPFGTANAVLIVAEPESDARATVRKPTRASRGHISAEHPSAQRESCCA